MSDETPAWVEALEDRLHLKMSAAHNDLEVRLVATVEKGEHALIEEVGKAINDSEGRLQQRIDDLRADMTRRFDQIHDDLTVNLARADIAIERVQQLEGRVHTELKQLQRRLRELEHWRDSRPGAAS